MAWGRFPTEDQLRHLRYETGTFYLDPLVLEVAANYS